MADNSKEGPSSAQEPVLGSSKDALFGWLVRRAGADLGLAEAIAASEAQRSEHIRRLEETLHKKLQEFELSSGGDAAAAARTQSIDELKSQLARVGARLEPIALAAQQACQMGESLKAEVVAAEERRAEGQARIEDRCSGVERTTQALRSSVEELQRRLNREPYSLEPLALALGELRVEVKHLSERVGNLETGDPSLGGVERARWLAEVDELTSARMRSYGDEMREELKAIPALQADMQSGKSDLANLRHRIGDMESVAQQWASELTADMSSLRAALAEERASQTAGQSRLADLDARVVARLNALEAERQEKWLGIEAQLSEIGGQWRSLIDQVASLAEQVNDQRRAQDSRDGAIQSLRGEILALAETLERAEKAAQEYRTATLGEMRRTEISLDQLGADLAGLSSGLMGQEQALSSVHDAIERAEALASQRFQQLQDRVEQQGRSADGQAQRLQNLERCLERFAERVAAAEGLAQRAHALMVNESEHGVQWRDALRAEVAALRSEESHSALPNEVVIRSLEETLSRKLGDWESRWNEKLRALELREAEWCDMRTQIESLKPRADWIGEATGSGTAASGLAVPVTIDEIRARRESAATSEKKTEERAVFGRAFVAGSTLGEVTGGGDKEQLRQLQERISADIERARAELREKSGRWKARR